MVQTNPTHRLSLIRDAGAWTEMTLKLVQGADSLEPTEVSASAVSVKIDGDSASVAAFLLRLSGGSAHNARMDPAAVSSPASQGVAPEVSRTAPAESVPVTPATPPTPAVPWSIEQALAEYRDYLTAIGKREGTLRTYASMVGAVAKFSGWTVIGDIRLEHVTAFIASRRRNDHGGKAWGDNTCRSCACACKALTAFLAKRKALPSDPLESLDSIAKADGKQKHPFTAEEARRLLAAAIGRHGRDRRSRGCAPLYFYVLFHTGLRYAEVASMTWADVTAEGELPGIWTDPAWTGNKNKRRAWIALPAHLAEMLLAWKKATHGRDRRRVFPIVPTPQLWHLSREDAGLPEHDADGFVYSPHAARASYITWLGQIATVPEGLRQRMARHAKGLTENVYTVRSKAEMAVAVAQLPAIWPDNTLPSNLFDEFSTDSGDNPSSLDSGDAEGMLNAEGTARPLVSPRSRTIEPSRGVPTCKRGVVGRSFGEPGGPGLQETAESRDWTDNPLLHGSILRDCAFDLPGEDIRAMIRSLTSATDALARILCILSAGPPLSEARHGTHGSGPDPPESRSSPRNPPRSGGRKADRD